MLKNSENLTFKKKLMLRMFSHFCIIVLLLENCVSVVGSNPEILVVQAKEISLCF